MHPVEISLSTASLPHDTDHTVRYNHNHVGLADSPHDSRSGGTYSVLLSPFEPCSPHGLWARNVKPPSPHSSLAELLERGSDVSTIEFRV